jgi:carboxymethylenebutenolidase
MDLGAGAAGSAAVDRTLRQRRSFRERLACVGEMISFASNGGTSEGYLAIPAGDASGTPVPGVIVIQEWWGLVHHVTVVADRFAAEGFLALAPDLYHGAQTGEPDEAMRLLMGLAMDQAAKDIAGAGAYLAGRPDCTGKLGAVGFCMGGSLALWAATLSEEITAAVGYYPPLPWERMQPVWPNYRGKAALIHTSEEDGGPEDPDILTGKRLIEEAGGAVTVHGYPGTRHAFFNDERPEVHDAAASELSWTRTLAFLRASLAAS